LKWLIQIAQQEINHVTISIFEVGLGARRILISASKWEYDQRQGITRFGDEADSTEYLVRS
jgi:hypothetical protein